MLCVHCYTRGLRNVGLSQVHKGAAPVHAAGLSTLSVMLILKEDAAPDPAVFDSARESLQRPQARSEGRPHVGSKPQAVRLNARAESTRQSQTPHKWVTKHPDVLGDSRNWWGGWQCSIPAHSGKITVLFLRLANFTLSSARLRHGNVR